MALMANQPRLTLFVLLICTQTLAQSNETRVTDFRKADSIAALYPGHSLKDLHLLTSKLTNGLPSDEEKFRAIYRWICDNISYDYALFVKSKQRQKQKFNNKQSLDAWNKKFTAEVFHVLATKQKTICTGYAYLLREMANYAELRCVIVHGYGRTSNANIGGDGVANHSWNAVMLRGQWYLCDATWSAGSCNSHTKEFEKSFDESYFLAKPSLFIHNHFPLDTAWLLLDNKPTLHQFLTQPLFYAGALQHNVINPYPETFNVYAEKGKPVTFSISGEKKITKGKLQIEDPVSSQSVSEPLQEDESGRYSIDHMFRSRGIHIVHIVLDDDYTLTYNVRVK
jgi:hypothetical protein